MKFVLLVVHKVFKFMQFMKPVPSLCTGIFAIVIVSGALCHATSYGQDVPVEDRVPASVAEIPIVTNMIERMRILRVNESKLGDKHPARKKIRMQIEELEKQLAERIAIEAPPPVRSPFRESSQSHSNPFRPKSDEAKSQLQGPPKDPSSSSKEPTSRLSRGVWEPNVVIPKFSTTGNATLKPAFPNLEIEALDLVGAFPALGLMWGIENDTVNDRTRVWQWHDHPDASKKALYWESAGRLTGFHFAIDFETSGYVYLLLEKKSIDHQVDEGNFEIIRVMVDKLPPFSFQDGSELVVASGQHKETDDPCLLQRSDGGLMAHHGKQGWMRSMNEQFTVVDYGSEYSLIKSSEKATDRKNAFNEQNRSEVELGFPIAWDQKNIIFIKREDNHLALQLGDTNESEFQSKSSNVQLVMPVRGSIVQNSKSSNGLEANVGDDATGMIWAIPIKDRGFGEQILRCRLSSRLKSIGVDSIGHPLVVSQDGMFRIQELPEKDRVIEPEIPAVLSDAHWFESLPSQVSASGFLQYSILEPVFTDGLTSRRWVGMPGDSSVDITRPSAWRFPNRTIVLKTIFKEYEWTEEGNQLPIETRALIKRDGQWFGLRYTWDREGRDASLVTEEQSDLQLGVWKVGIDTRRCGDRNTNNCNVCHGRSTNDYLFSFNAQALDVALKGFVNDSQLDSLLDGKVLATHAPRTEGTTGSTSKPSWGILVEPYSGGEETTNSTDSTNEDQKTDRQGHRQE